MQKMVKNWLQCITAKAFTGTDYLPPPEAIQMDKKVSIIRCKGGI